MLRHLSKLFLLLFVLASCLQSHAACTAGTTNANLGEFTPSSAFTVNSAAGTVTHSLTGLTWKQCSQGLSGATCSTGSATPMNWSAALTTAATDVWDGGGWRLPNKKELESIVETCGYNPSINKIVFPNTPLQGYWASSTHAPTPTRAWTTYFDLGSSVDHLKSDATYYVRLVRGGQTWDIFDAQSDSFPNAFTFTAQVGTALSSVATSNPITVTGINTTSAISIVGGEYAVSVDSGLNYGAWSSTPGSVSLNNYVLVHQNTSSSYNTKTTATLTIGTVSAAFDVTTAAVPTVTSINPSHGSTAGGYSVSIGGTNFLGASAVTIGGNACTSPGSITAISLTCTAPAGTGLTKDVVVTTPAGSGTSTGSFNYDSPTVLSINPSSGTTAGGTSVTISGSNLRSATGVTIGGNACNSLSANTDTSVTCTTTAGSAGAVSVVVTTASGSNAGNTLYTYVTPAPVLSMSPTSISFAAQTVNTTSVVQTMRLTNIGNATLTLSIAASANFSQVNGCGGTLGAAVSCDINVTFTPTTSGNSYGVITITSNATGSPNNFTLSGTGRSVNAPICSLSAVPATIDRNGTSTLTATCNPAATSFTWTVGTCQSNTGNTCIVSPSRTDTYAVSGANGDGVSSASVQVKVRNVDLTPILMLLMD